MSGYCRPITVRGGSTSHSTPPKPARPLTVPEVAEVVAGTIGALGVASPVVIGHSMGCQVVVDAIAGHPELCCAYVLIGPTVDPAARRPRGLLSVRTLGTREIVDIFSVRAAPEALAVRPRAEGDGRDDAVADLRRGAPSGPLILQLVVTGGQQGQDAGGLGSVRRLVRGHAVSLRVKCRPRAGVGSS
ncbi:MAG: alpha/beta hydrolase [Micrococcus sp.]|nr:alpha/beta hydrolase [Micrococcus sp.]